MSTDKTGGTAFMIVIILGGCANIAMLPVSLILGIIGLCQPRTRKVYASWGIRLSLLPFLFVACVIIFMFLWTLLISV